MARHFIAPTDREPFAGFTIMPNGKRDWWVLPEEASRFVTDELGSKVKQTYNPRLELLNSLGPGDEIFAPLGGLGDSFLIGAYQRGVTVKRTPFKTFLDMPWRKDVIYPETLANHKAKKPGKQAERLQRVAQMVEYVDQEQDVFRLYEEPDARISGIRDLLSQLLGIQDEIRKRLAQRLDRSKRDRVYLLNQPSSNHKGTPILGFVSSVDPVADLVTMEGELTKQIEKLLRGLPVYTEVLEPVKGIGPRLAARLIGPIVDIRRFQKVEQFTKYVGWANIRVDGNGHPRDIADRFVRGNSAGFQAQARLGMYLFGKQILRNRSQFEWYLRGYHEKKLPSIGQIDHIDNDGQPVVMTDPWLWARAERYAVGKFSRYLFWGWWELYGREFTHTHHGSGVPFRARQLLSPQDYYESIGVNLFEPIKI